MRTFYFFAILIPLIGFACSATIDCKYEDSISDVIGGTYQCKVQNDLAITSPDTAVIESVNGVHKDGKSNDDVNGFYVSYNNIQHFPQGLDKFFKNLKMIIIYDNGLKEIHQSDLKPFPQLVELYLGGNKIENLEEGLFNFNPQLEYIGLSGNRLSHIHPNVFDNLSHLNTLWLSDNKCISMYAENNPTKLKEVIQRIKSRCQN